MNLYEAGYSNIRFSGDNVNFVHTYNYRSNTFPEEVFIHEFLHTLERIGKEHGFATVDLHSYEKFGYSEIGLTGLKDWYQDYLRGKILDKENNCYIGLDEKVLTLKPSHDDNFDYALEIKFNKEPSNLIEEINSLIDVLVGAIKK